MITIRNSIFAATLAATTLAGVTPAMARDHRRGGDDTAAVAIGAGVIGLALGAIIASSDNDRDRDRYDDRYYGNGYAYNNGYAYGPAYSNGWYYRDGWYWDRDGRRHSRSDYYRNRRHDDHRRGYDRNHDERRRGY